MEIVNSGQRGSDLPWLLWTIAVKNDVVAVKNMHDEIDRVDCYKRFAAISDIVINDLQPKTLVVLYIS